MDWTEALAAALRMILSLDREVCEAASVSLQVSLAATLLSAAVGIPIGYLVGRGSFRGRRLAELCLGTLTAMPTVVVGLVLYSLLSRRGPLGPLGLLYTRGAIVAGETLLAIPLVATLTLGVVTGADPRIHDTALTLGATRLRAALALLSECRRALLAALATTFGRLVSELGVALMVGGNIAGATRTLTTAIALETAKGELALGFALGLILLGLALAVNVAAGSLGSPREARP